jgi:formylglycine-generating enzyme required for sulfatase activity
MLLWLGTGYANQEISVDLPGGATMEMVWIEPGTFMMGSPAGEVGRSPDEGPQHQVTLSKGFYLGTYEITQGQWSAVMGRGPWSGDDKVPESPDIPATFLSWNDLQGFVHTLNVETGDSLYRLPTEAEWEYACRAGTKTRWSFGDEESQLGAYGWYKANAVGEQYGHAVGTKKPNPWGLFDLNGNVTEWCQDWYGAYSGSSQTDPPGPATGSYRVKRGGFFGDDAQGTRSAFRYFGSPGYRDSSLGARLLKTK